MLFQNSYTTCTFNLIVSHKQVFFYLEHLFFHMVVVMMIWKSQDGDIVCVYGCMNEVWSSILQLFSMLINLQTQQQVLKKSKWLCTSWNISKNFFLNFYQFTEPLVDERPLGFSFIQVRGWLAQVTLHRWHKVRPLLPDHFILKFKNKGICDLFTCTMCNVYNLMHDFCQSVYH